MFRACTLNTGVHIEKVHRQDRKYRFPRTDDQWRISSRHICWYTTSLRRNNGTSPRQPDLGLQLTSLPRHSPWSCYTSYLLTLAICGIVLPLLPHPESYPSPDPILYRALLRRRECGAPIPQLVLVSFTLCHRCFARILTPHSTGLRR